MRYPTRPHGHGVSFYRTRHQRVARVDWGKGPANGRKKRRVREEGRRLGWGLGTGKAMCHREVIILVLLTRRVSLARPSVCRAKHERESERNQPPAPTTTTTQRARPNVQTKPTGDGDGDVRCEVGAPARARTDSTLLGGGGAASCWHAAAGGSAGSGREQKAPSSPPLVDAPEPDAPL